MSATARLRQLVESAVPGMDDQPTECHAGVGAGIGVDVEQIERWHEVDDRLFTAAEHVHCAVPSAPDRAARYAGRWCAKEAVVKALGCAGARPVSLRDIEIRVGAEGQPVVSLPEDVSRRGWFAIVSIAHDGGHAVAVARVWRV